MNGWIDRVALAIYNQHMAAFPGQQVADFSASTEDTIAVYRGLAEAAIKAMGIYPDSAFSNIERGELEVDLRDCHTFKSPPKP